jgi:DNA-dependent RNA polymerase auxiliary subunit epsilon
MNTFCLKNVVPQRLDTNLLFLECNGDSNYREFQKAEANAMADREGPAGTPSVVLGDNGIEIHLMLTRVPQDIQISHTACDITVRYAGYDEDARRSLYRIKTIQPASMEDLDYPCPDHVDMIELIEEMNNKVAYEFQQFVKKKRLSVEYLAQLEDLYAFLSKKNNL